MLTAPVVALPDGYDAPTLQQNRPVRIVNVYGSRNLRVGQRENFRVRVNDGAAWPITYRWSMGDGTLTEGNNVVHAYQRPGRYRVIVTARNARGMATDSIFVTVTAPPRVVVPAEVEESAPRAAGVGDPPVEAPAGTAPTPAVPASPLRGPEGIAWDRGGYTLMAASHFDRDAAERHALRLRRSGYRVGIVVDQKQGASTAYRVVVGQFFGDDAAARGRESMLRANLPGTWIVLKIEEILPAGH